MNNTERWEKINRLSDIVGFKLPLDGLLCMVFERPEIDVIKMDKRLMATYNYKESMNEFMREFFGQESVDIMNELFLKNKNNETAKPY